MKAIAGSVLGAALLFGGAGMYCAAAGETPEAAEEAKVETVRIHVEGMT